MRKDAGFSECRAYRYWLSRTWDESLPPLVVIGLNPSTADETQDDPTIRRCVGYAKRWNLGGLTMLNIFAYRATDPNHMKRAFDPVGPQNDDYLRLMTGWGGVVLAAWGNHGAYLQRGKAVRGLLANRGLCCLATTKAGEPQHPLYLRADLQPQVLA